MKTSNVTITKKDNEFIIKKNENFKFMFTMTNMIYDEIKKSMNLSLGIGLQFNEKKEFLDIITNLSSDNKVSILTEDEATKLVSWIDIICNTLLEKEDLDLKNEELNKYFKISSKFNKKTIKLLSDKTPVSK